MPDNNSLNIFVNFDDGKSKLKINELKDGIKNLGLEVPKVDQRFKGLGNTLPKVGQGIGDLGKKLPTTTGNAKAFSSTWININRVIQDSPYGLIGIANNLDMLSEGLVRGSKDAGGFKNFVSGLTQSLTGPQGLMLAFSSVTALAVAFGPQIKSLVNEMFDVVEVSEEAVKKLLSTKDVMTDYLRSLDGLKTSDYFDTSNDERTLQILKAQVDEYEMMITGTQKISQQAQHIQMSAGAIAEQQKRVAEYQEAIKLLNEDIDKLESEIAIKRRASESALANQFKYESDLAKLLQQKDISISDDININNEISPNEIDYSELNKKASEERNERLRAEIAAIKITETNKVQAALATASKVQQLNIQEQQELAQIESLKLQNHELYENAKLSITEKYSSKREAVEKQKSESEIQRQERITQIRASQMGMQVANAIESAKSEKEAIKGVINAVISQIIANSILAAFTPPTPASLGLAPIFAAGAKKLIGSLIPGFATGGLIRVSNGEYMIPPSVASSNMSRLQQINGGYISGPGTGTSDSIVTKAQPGSFVVNAAATAKHRSELDNMMKFSNGGQVPTSNISIVNFPMDQFDAAYSEYKNLKARGY